MPLSLRDTGYVLAVARHGLLSAAADELGVTQPALTKAVQRVEAEFGTPLFERTGKGMVPTSAGLSAIAQLRRLGASHADTQMLASEMRAQRAGLLRVGVTDASGDSPVVDVIATLLAQRPGMRMRLQHGRSDVLAAQVVEGELDAAIVPTYDAQPLPGVCSRIGSDPMRLVVRRRHPLAKQDGPAIRDLVPYGWVLGGASSASYRRIEQAFAERDLPAPSVVLEVPYTSFMSAEVLARSNLIGLVPASFLRRTDGARFAVLSVPELRLERSVMLITRASSSKSHLLAAMHDALLRHAKASKP